MRLDLDEEVQERWVQDLVIDGVLTKRQAKIVVYVAMGYSCTRIAGKVGTDPWTVWRLHKKALSIADRHRPTELLIYGPHDFLDNPNDYPELNRRLIELTGAGKEDMEDGKLKITIERGGEAAVEVVRGGG